MGLDGGMIKCCSTRLSRAARLRRGGEPWAYLALALGGLTAASASYMGWRLQPRVN
jgi:hypothetical protein